MQLCGGTPWCSPVPPQFAPWATSRPQVIGHALIWMFLNHAAMVTSFVPSQTLPHPKSHVTRGRPPAVCVTDLPPVSAEVPRYQKQNSYSFWNVPSGTILPLALHSGFELPPAEPLEQRRQLPLPPGGLVLQGASHLFANSFGSSRHAWVSWLPSPIKQKAFWNCTSFILNTSSGERQPRRSDLQHWSHVMDGGGRAVSSP